ncbi:hypothetical protein OSB04_015996 [Centaurea solstitialis]|uniref:Uncharacterized protein n=1 Tax=Centaurea solstitialis TaxID=347529 RepID=A0AA38TB66_9ASTR|nr:hypothetical protein OSB04_015996 [Centaurea solstitialis]
MFLDQSLKLKPISPFPLIPPPCCSPILTPHCFQEILPTTMATIGSIPPISHSLSSWSCKNLFKPTLYHKSHVSFTIQNPKRLKISVKAQKETEESPVSVASAEHEKDETHMGSELGEQNGGEIEGNEQQQELDWKSDGEFKKFMGNPSIEAAIKLEKKRTDRKLKELDREREAIIRSSGFLINWFAIICLEKNRGDLATGDFYGNLRRPIEEVIPALEEKLSEAAGREVVLWFMEEKSNDITKQITTRVTAARYGVETQPVVSRPLYVDGCLGVMNNYESLLPNKKALFDIPVARTASAYLTSLALALAAFVADGSFNGGDNALNGGDFVELVACGRLEGGRMAQAMFGRSTAALLSFATSLLLVIGGLNGSVLCLAWGLFATFFRGGEEIPAKEKLPL